MPRGVEEVEYVDGVVTGRYASLVLFGQQFELSRRESTVLDITAYTGVPNRIAKSFSGVGIAVIVDLGAVDEIGFTVDSHGQVASITGKIELALTA